MAEENVQTSTQEAQNLGKFKSVDALLHAYEQLEAEFTRRSQRLKQLEEGKTEQPASPTQEQSEEQLYDAVKASEGVKSRIVSEYLSSLKGVPLMAGGGVELTAPKTRAKSFAEAGKLALGYFRGQKND